MDTDKQNKKNERRRARRVYASFVEYCRVEDASSKRLQAFTENISSTGIRIFVNEELEAGSFLYISIYLLDGTDSIETKGKVVWINPSTFLHIKDEKHYDVGIEFTEIDKEDQKRLQLYSVQYYREAPPSQNPD